MEPRILDKILKFHIQLLFNSTCSSNDEMCGLTTVFKIPKQDRWHDFLQGGAH
jgi:hypothetical protein